MQRTLVMRGGALGDFLLTVPALNALRQSAWGGDVELWGYAAAGRLAPAGGLADRFRSLDEACMASLFSPGAAADARLAEALRGFDRVLCYLRDPGGTLRRRLDEARVAQRVMACPLPTRRHAALHLLEPLVQAGLTGCGPPDGRLRVPAVDREQAQRELGRVGPDPWAVHPGSGSATKNWPLERFAQLARQLQAEGLGSPFFLLGEAERQWEARLARLAPGMPVISGRPIEAVAACLSCCAGYAGNDSGITHLAAAVGTPTVAVFRATDPAVWGPLGDHVRIVDGREPSDTGGALRAARDLRLAWRAC
jgi:heptosyltransferase-2